MDVIDRAKALRREQTYCEQRLWSRLRNRQLGGWKWRRQEPQSGFILDFYCRELKLAVELDGGQHAEPEKLAYDARRTAALAKSGVKVLRFWNVEVVEDIDSVCETILAAADGRF